MRQTFLLRCCLLGVVCVLGWVGYLVKIAKPLKGLTGGGGGGKVKLAGVNSGAGNFGIGPLK